MPLYAAIALVRRTGEKERDEEKGNEAKIQPVDWFKSRLAILEYQRNLQLAFQFLPHQFFQLALTFL